MGWRIFFSLLFIIVVIGLLVFYWFIPTRTTEFIPRGPINSNFSLSNSVAIDMQFYPNMRYPSRIITYKIYNCSLQKKNDMERAFEILSNKTILKFNPAENEEISVTCDNKVKMEEGLFIAGEGGPTKIVQTDLFNVILKGKVLLIRDSSCPNPNIAIHELLHALGFDHSENKNNIMYPVSKCEQTIGDDTIALINELYKTPTYPDLSFENVSAVLNGRYLKAEISVKNDGLIVSKEGKIFIYADDDLENTFDLKPLDIGAGLKMTLENVWISRRNPEKLKFVIDYDFEELDKNNNEIILEVSH